MQWIQLATMEAEISVTPVVWDIYARFASETGRPAPPQSGAMLQSFVTGVSATDASAFTVWFSELNGGHYRLPTLDEMLALAHQAHNRLEVSPWCFWQPESGAVRDYFFEWLSCTPDQSAGCRERRCVTHPAWLFTRPPRSVRAALADTAYPFVLFRLVRLSSLR